MGFSRQEYWSGLLFPPPEDLPNSAIEPTSLASYISSILTWKIPWTEEPGGLQSMRLQSQTQLNAHMCAHTHTIFYCIYLPHPFGLGLWLSLGLVLVLGLGLGPLLSLGLLLVLGFGSGLD